jgi:hypothetical protein
MYKPATWLTEDVIKKEQSEMRQHPTDIDGKDSMANGILLLSKNMVEVSHEQKFKDNIDGKVEQEAAQKPCKLQRNSKRVVSLSAEQLSYSLIVTSDPSSEVTVIKKLAFVLLRNQGIALH